MPGLGRWVLPAVVVAVLVIVLAGPLRVSVCDGPAPGWVENEGGCASWSTLEYLLPWHWGVPDQCLGLCPEPFDAG